MGSTFWTTCQTCRKDAPDLGDCGFIGLPSPSTQPQDRPDRLQPFGYIYQGFLAVGVEPADMHDFHTFLRAHNGHDLRTFSDQDPEAYDEERDSEDSDEDEGEDEDDDVGIPEGFAMCLYEIECQRCERSVRTESEACVRKATALRLTPAAVTLFQERVRDTLDDNFYRSEPFGSNDLQEIFDFLDEHGTHDAIARTIPSEDPSS